MSGEQPSLFREGAGGIARRRLSAVTHRRIVELRKAGFKIWPLGHHHKILGKGLDLVVDVERLRFLHSNFCQQQGARHGTQDRA